MQTLKKHRTVKEAKKKKKNTHTHTHTQDDMVRVDKDDMSGAENGIVAIITVFCVKNEG